MAYAERVAGDGSELSASRVANMAAGGILADFDSYQGAFRAVTRRARGRFEAGDWQGAVEDAIERLDLYGRVIGQVEADVRRMLGNRVSDRLVWAGMKAVYSGLIAGRQEWEIAETFFNSVTRRVFATVGVDANIEFVDSDFGAPSELDADLLCRSYRGPADGAQLVHDLLRDFAFEAPFQDLRRDAGLAAARLKAYLRSLGDAGGTEAEGLVEGRRRAVAAHDHEGQTRRASLPGPVGQIPQQVAPVALHADLRRQPHRDPPRRAVRLDPRDHVARHGAVAA